MSQEKESALPAGLIAAKAGKLKTLPQLLGALELPLLIAVTIVFLSVAVHGQQISGAHVVPANVLHIGNSSPQSFPTTSSKGPKDAAVTIIEFSDFECPFSAKVQAEIEELLQAHSEKVRLIFKHNPLPFHAHSMLAHEAAIAAGAQGRFWEMHDILFKHQTQLDQASLLQYANDIHLDIDSFRNALESQIYKPLVDEDLDEARGLGVNGTPTFFINGKKMVGAQSREAFEAAMNEAMGLPFKGPAGQNPNLLPGIGEAKPPATVENVEVGASPVRGPTEAPVTIVEFADFQCPFCTRAVPTIQELIRDYPKGVRWVFKNFPLDFHPDSLLAHKAALAAGEQGKFWEMHDLIFAGQGVIRRDDLIQKATQLGLDVKRFIADIDGDRFQKILADDKAEAARLGVTGTPTFFVNGRQMVGAWPLAEYKKLVESELNSGKEKLAVAAPPVPAVVPVKEKKQPASGLEYKAPSKGPEAAPITITWYSDLASPLTPQAALLVRQITDAYPEKTRVLFKNLPMDFHPQSFLAHQAALAAGAQGKFWEMHDLILANQRALTREDLISYAKRLGLNTTRFASSLEADDYRKIIENDLSEARGQGVFGSPAFFVNGKRLDGLQTPAVFKAVIQAELDQLTAVRTGQ